MLVYIIADANVVLDRGEVKSNSMTEQAAWATRPESLQKLTLRDKVWRYQGEGNANVVLSVPADGTVVRVMKESDGGGGGETTAAEAETAETLSVRLRFCDAVRRAFFGGGSHVDVPVPMRVAAEELRDIDRLIRPRRPPGRQHRGLGWAGCLVAVCPDYTALPPTDVPGVWCVEIKPKQGWVHEDDVVAGGVRGKCPFCAHQYLKLARGDVRRPSDYCPLDMFSGRRERVRRAVRALLRDPQNNLKMFLDGDPLAAPDDGFGAAAGEALGSVQRFCAVVTGALLGDFDGGVPMDGQSDAEEDECRSAASGAVPPRPCDFADAVPMPRHCVLHEILTMQQMQTIGFAAVCSEYDGRPPRDPQFGHVDRLQRLNDDGGRDAAWSPVDGYLVAATARDCSVFVTFRRPTGNSLAAVRVKVSDLDPKPLSTVDKHRNRNAKVSFACQRYLDE